MPVIAVIGASCNRSKFGNKALRAFRRQGFTVVPIHPREELVEGERAFASVLDYPGHIDEAALYVPPEIGVGVVDEIARKGIPVVWLNPGADDPAVVARARRLGLEARVACSILSLDDGSADE
jgi:predicted CoA-binding protein